MDNEYSAGRIICFYVIAKYMIGCFFFNAVCRHRKKSVSFINDNQKLVFVHNTQTTMLKHPKSSFKIYRQFITGMQKIIELCRRNIIYCNLTMGQKRLYRCLTLFRKQREQIIQQLDRTFLHRICLYRTFLTMSSIAFSIITSLSHVKRSFYFKLQR